MADNVLKETELRTKAIKAKFEPVDIQAALKGSNFKDKAKEIATYLKRKNIQTIEQIENLPRLGHVLGCDVYALTAAILEGAKKPVEEKPVARVVINPVEVKDNK